MGKGTGKGSKGGYYSSGGGGDCCDFEEYPCTSLCWLVTAGWFIYVMILAFSTVPSHRYSENPILHSGEMRILELPTENAYAKSTSQFTDTLGLIDIYRVDGEPPLLTPTAALAQNKSARVVIEPLRDTYGFPDQYDWWYQNAWMTPGSKVTLQTRCTGAAWLNIITGDYAFFKWRKAANGEDEEADRADWVAQRRYFATGDGIISWTQPTPSDEIYFTVMKDSTDEGDTIDCSMMVNITLIPYDLSGIQLTYPASRQVREFDSKAGHTKILLVAPIPLPGKNWFDIGTWLEQDIPSILRVGPLMGLMAGGVVGLTLFACIFDQIECCRKGCIFFAVKGLLGSFYCWGCDWDWGFCRCNLWDWDDCECKKCNCCSCDDWCNVDDVPIDRSPNAGSPASVNNAHPVGITSPTMDAGDMARLKAQMKKPEEMEMQGGAAKSAHNQPVPESAPVAVVVTPTVAIEPAAAAPAPVASTDVAPTVVVVPSDNSGPNAPPPLPSAPSDLSSPPPAYN